MAERGDVVSMVGVSEPTATVVGRPVAVDETLMEPPSVSEGRMEGPLGGEDGGEIMVEVVGADVFVDGVSGEEGGGDWNQEEGAGEVAKQGLGREAESVDGEGGEVGSLAPQEVGETPIEGREKIVGSLDEQTNVAAEEVVRRVNEVGLEKGQHLAGGAVEAGVVLDSQGASVLPDEAWNSEIEAGMEGSLAISGSSSEKTEVVDRVMVTVTEASSEKGLVEEGVKKGTKSDEGGGCVLDELDELWNPGIGAAVVCSSSVAQASSKQTPFVADEAATMVKDEILNHKDEVPVSGVDEENFTFSENDQGLLAETSCVGGEKQVEVPVGGEVGLMGQEEVLHPKGDLCCSVKDQQTKVETADENTETQVDSHADSISFHEPTSAVAGSKIAMVDDKVFLNPNVVSSMNVVLGGVGVDAGEVGIVCAEPESSNEQNKAINGNEGSIIDDSKVSNSDVEIPPNDGTDRTVACSEDDHNRKLEITCGPAGKDSYDPVGSESLTGQACVAEIREVAAMEVEAVVNVEGEVAGDAFDGSHSGKTQYSEVKKVDGSCQNDVVDRALESSGKQIQITNRSDIVVTGKEVAMLESEGTMKDGEEVSNFQNEVMDVDVCLQKNEDLKILNVGGSDEKDGIALGNAEASDEQIEIDKRVESSVLDSQGIVKVSACQIPDEAMSLSEKADKLKVETLGEPVSSSVHEGMMKDGEEVSNFQNEVFDGDTCLQKVEDLKILNVGGNDEEDGIALGNAEASDEQIEIDKRVESSVLDPQGIVKVSACLTPDEATSLSENAGELKAEISGEPVPSSVHEGMVKDGEGVSNFQNEVLDGDTCLQKVEDLKILNAGGSDEKDGIALGNAEASGGQIEIDKRVESSALDSQGIVEVSSCRTPDEATSLSEKAGELKFETSGEPVSSSVGEGMVKDGEEVSNFQNEVLDGNTCLQKVEDLKILKVGGGDEKDGIALGNAEASGEQIEIDKRVESSVLDSQGIVKVSACHTPDEATSLSEKAGELKVDILGDPLSSSVSELLGAFPNEPKNLEHMVSGGISVPSENQIIATCVSHAVNSDEMLNPESNDESYKANEHVPEGQASNKSMVGSLVVDLDTCLNKDGKCKLRDDPVEENVSLPNESQFIKDDVQAMEDNVGLEFSECLDGIAAGDLCLDDSSAGQEQIQGQYTDAGHVDLYIGQGIEMGEQAADHEQTNFIEDKSLKQMTPRSGSFEKLPRANYLLPPEKEGEFSVSDLVWGKVRSHPWWPGQIFDTEDASEKAMKYHKKDCFLVAYFGDRTFAWNEASLLKPFWTNFSQIEKQSNSETFQNAVSCALEEVSRRVELGLACSCISKEAHDKIESQIVENSGIRQESSRRYGVDKTTGVSSFEPARLVEYIRGLAKCPSAGADRLELLVAKAQLLAVNRLKGYSWLPEIQFCGGLLENNADSSQLGEVIDHAPNGEQILSSKGRLKAENSSSHKRKHNLKDSTYPRKKERSLSELMGDAASSPDGEEGSDWKASSKPVSLSSVKKRKSSDIISDSSEVQDRRISIYAAKVSPIPKPSFKVGDCIRRVASQLTGSPSILKCSSEKFQKIDGSSDVDVSLQTPDNSQRGRVIFPMEYSSLDEMLSQLHLAAQDPMRGYDFMTTVTTFFSGFRNSVSLVQSSGRQGGGRKKKASHAIIGSAEEFDFDVDDVNDSYWTDRIIQNNSEEQSAGDGQNRGVEYQIVAFDPDKSIKSSRRSYSRKRFSNGNHNMDEPIGYSDERKHDNSPAELVLNFSEGDRIPSEMNLNRIFRRFGPLKESETEVDLETSRARVVFKRRSDAEVAFSSAGKFSIFGPIIVDYQLSDTPPISFKPLPIATTQGEEDLLSASQAQEEAT